MSTPVAIAPSTAGSAGLDAQNTSQHRLPPVSGKFFVTGGSGYLGRLVTRMLLAQGADQVVVFDVRPVPPDTWGAVAADRVRTVLGDIRYWRAWCALSVVATFCRCRAEPGGEGR